MPDSPYNAFALKVAAFVMDVIEADGRSEVLHSQRRFCSEHWAAGRGRTGRRRQGEVVVLVAEGTRDERAKDSARRKEDFMHKSARRVSRGLSGSPHKDLSNLTRFTVSTELGVRTAAEFVIEARERHRGELSTADSTMVEPARNPLEDLPPSNFRPSGQTGLDQF